MDKKTGLVIGIAVGGIGGAVAYELYRSSQKSKQSTNINAIGAVSSESEVTYTNSKDLFDITGQALDVNGNGVPNATVYLWAMNNSSTNPSWSPITSTTTDSNGNFDFAISSSLVTIGQYTFYVSNQNKVTPNLTFKGINYVEGSIITRGFAY